MLQVISLLTKAYHSLPKHSTIFPKTVDCTFIVVRIYAQVGVLLPPKTENIGITKILQKVAKKTNKHYNFQLCSLNGSSRPGGF